MKYLLPIITLLCLPFGAFAHEVETTAGTDEYLRHELGFTDEQLTTQVATEEREPFRYSTGAGTVDDVLGDVLDRYGSETTLNQPWADIDEAKLEKNLVTQRWDLTVTLGKDLPIKPTEKVQLFFFADTDGDATNNAPDGIRINMDAEFAVQLNQEQGWYTDFRWYNDEADFWAINKETSSTFAILGRTIALHIPFTELSGDRDPNWRVMMAISNGDRTEIDSAQDVGFPAPKNAVTPETPDSAPDSSNGTSQTWIAFGLVVLAVVVVGFAGIRLLKR